MNLVFIPSFIDRHFVRGNQEKNKILLNKLRFGIVQDGTLWGFGIGWSNMVRKPLFRLHLGSEIVY